MGGLLVLRSAVVLLKSCLFTSLKYVIGLSSGVSVHAGREKRQVESEPAACPSSPKRQLYLGVVHQAHTANLEREGVVLLCSVLCGLILTLYRLGATA